GKKAQPEVKVKTQHKPEDCSVTAEDGDEVAVHYTGILESGAVFDSSVQAQREPLVFTLGWEIGIKGMCVGEKRKLVIPPHLAYGQQGYPPTIPEDATLTFETELVDLRKRPFNFPVMQTIQLLSVPALVLYILYYLYDRYKKEASETKESKKSKKRK
ncbi:hypothetical protein BaRGS_00019596, partial [Batillaria attramentaria]